MFNVADCFITCGCAALLIHLIFFNKNFGRTAKHDFIRRHPGERLDAFLSRSVEDLSRSAAQKLLEEGCVKRNGNREKK